MDGGLHWHFDTHTFARAGAWILPGALMAIGAAVLLVVAFIIRSVGG